MYKLADISAFERLGGLGTASDMSVFNDDYTFSGPNVDDNSLIGMSDLSDNIYEYLRDAANSIVDKIWSEYQRPNVNPMKLASMLLHNVGSKFKECGDEFGKYMFERVAEIAHSTFPIGKSYKVNWDITVNGIPTFNPIFDDDDE